MIEQDIRNLENKIDTIAMFLRQVFLAQFTEHEEDCYIHVFKEYIEDKTLAKTSDSHWKYKLSCSPYNKKACRTHKTHTDECKKNLKARIEQQCTCIIETIKDLGKDEYY